MTVGAVVGGIGVGLGGAAVGGGGVGLDGATVLMAAGGIEVAVDRTTGAIGAEVGVGANGGGWVAQASPIIPANTSIIIRDDTGLSASIPTMPRF